MGFQLTIVTPEGIKFQNEAAERLIVPTQAGTIGVMQNHEPLIGVVIAGELEILLEGNGEFSFAISKGLIQIEAASAAHPGGTVRILADTAERAEEIDLDRAEAARRRAQEYLTNTEDVTDYATVELLQAKIDKEMAREQVGRKYKDVGRPTPAISGASESK